MEISMISCRCNMTYKKNMNIKENDPNISNITDTITSNHTNDADSNNGNIEMIIPLITIVPCGKSLVCLISLMVYTLIKLLIKKN